MNRFRAEQSGRPSASRRGRAPGPWGCLASAAFVCLALSAPAWAGDESPRVLIVHKADPPRVRYWQVSTEFEKSNLTPIWPEPFTSREEYQWWINLHVEPAPDRPHAQVRWEIDRIRGVRRETRSEVRFDSLMPDPANPQTAELATWAGRVLSFRLGPHGRTSALSGFSATRPTVRVTPGRGPALQPPSHEAQIEMLTDLFGSYLPRRPVAAGESWTVTRSVQRAPYGAFVGEIRCELRSLEARNGGTLAHVDFRGALALSASPTPAGADQRHHDVRSALWSGSVVFDADRGDLIEFDGREELSLELVMSSASRPTASRAATQPAKAPRSYTFKIDERRRLRVRASDTAPVKPVVVQAPRPTPPPTTPAATRPAVRGRFPAATRPAVTTRPRS